MKKKIVGRSFLTLLDYNSDEINYLLDIAGEFKKKKKSGEKGDLLVGKNVALLFEKLSTRTRCAFVVAARDEGGSPEFLGKNDIHLGKKESIKDTARVLGRMFDGIAFRGFAHRTVEILAEYSGLPVWNGLTDKYHPTQVLADFLTIKENLGKLQGINLVYVGDGRNNVANSLMIGSAKMGINFKIITPSQLQPEEELVNICKELAEKNQGTITITDDPVNGIKDTDVIYTDVWVSMGEEDSFADRIELLKPYQVNMEMIENTGNKELIFLHCLPAYHNLETKIGKEINESYGLEAMEVTEDVFESQLSRVFDQAENRMHTIKAVMVATINN